MQRTPFEIPDQMREVADRSVEQAKKAISQYLDATQQAVAKAEGSAKSMRDGAAEVSRQALAFVEENVAASFDFAHRLVQARTVEEIAALAEGVHGEADGEPRRTGQEPRRHDGACRHRSHGQGQEVGAPSRLVIVGFHLCVARFMLQRTNTSAYISSHRRAARLAAPWARAAPR